MNKNQKVKRIISVVINSVFYVVIALILVISLGVITSKNRNEITNVFGRGIVPILTDSMDGTQSDSFKEGALLIVNVLTPEAKQNLQPGDIIVFYSIQYDALIAHRIIEVNSTIGYVITRGDRAEIDAAASGNPIESYNDSPVSFHNIQAISATIIPGVGSVITYLQTPTGFGIVIVIPTILFLAYAIVRFIRDFVKSKEEKLLQQNEEDKALLRQQLLEELKKEQNNNIKDDK